MNETLGTTPPSTDNVSAISNETVPFDKIYVFRPLNPSAKLAMVLSLIVIGIIGFVGNILILLFLRKKDASRTILRTCSFQMNYHFYIKSLAISDLLSSVTAVPLMCLRFYVDVFQSGWGCKIVRYVMFVFPCVTINNLLVISSGKYLLTRQVPRVFKLPTVKRIVLFAWLAGFVVSLFIAATFEGIRYEVNDTHYTVMCRFNTQYLSFRIISYSVTLLQYIIPSCILLKISISLIITLWTSTGRTIDVQRDNGIRVMARAARFRSIYTVLVLTIAFIAPYLCFVANVVYNMTVKPELDFETEQAIRYISGIIVYSNSAVNVIIYLVRMRDFRFYLGNLIVEICSPNEICPA